jgi:hypothetical protein
MKTTFVAMTMNDNNTLTAEQLSLLPQLQDLFNSGQRANIALSLLQLETHDIPFEMVAGRTREEYMELGHWLVKMSKLAPDSSIAAKIAFIKTCKCLYVVDWWSPKSEDHIPPSIGLLSELEELDISNGIVSSLPSSLCRLKKLRVLNVEGNYLRTLPFDIGALQALEVLNLSNNSLYTLPKSFEKLCNLKYLDLSSNQLRSVPLALSKLHSLLDLNLSDNKLHRLPSYFGNLKSLENLNLYGNVLTKRFPFTMSRLKKLTTFFYDSDGLEFPDFLFDLDSLSSFSLPPLPTPITLELRGLNRESKKKRLKQFLSKKYPSWHLCLD